MPTVIHVSPHPDDESIAVPCTLLALQDAGWDVVNFAVGLGRPEDRERRAAELARALGHAGFQHHTPKIPVGISRGDDLGAACRTVTRELLALVRTTNAELVVGPHPRDGHHGHVAVARGIRQAVRQLPGPLTWWMWSIWVDLPRPTLIVECDPLHLKISEAMLDEYTGENGRNDYRAMHRPIREVNAIRGVEKTLGFGAAPVERLRAIRYAELLTEVTVVRRPGGIGVNRARWQIGRPRLFDPADDAEWIELGDRSILRPTRFRPALRQWVMPDLAARRSRP